MSGSTARNPTTRSRGLSKENHGPYCRDALRALLSACPFISGITFRIHGESGVPEGNYDLWKTVFEGVAQCGRKVEIDMHAKGMDQGMIDVALATGMPVNISPKYWAEHLGMPYHQAEIRELERPQARRGGLRPDEAQRRVPQLPALWLWRPVEAKTADMGCLHRIWPGTQRLLLWGDPLTGAAHGRAFSFCGSDGVEIMEPLSFKGRRGSGIAGDRCGYADASLKPRWDWQKYQYTLRVWGRLLYNPDADPDVWRRYLRTQFAAGGSGRRGGAGQRLTHPAGGNHRPRGFGRKQHLLGRDVHQPADRRSETQAPLQRQPGSQGLRQRQSRTIRSCFRRSTTSPGNS